MADVDWSAFSAPPAATPTPNPFQHAWQSIISGVQHPDEAVKSLGKRMEHKPWFNALKDVSTIPAEGVANVLGAGERVNTQQLNDLLSGRNRRGVFATQMGSALAGPLGLAASAVHPDARRELGNQFYAAFHPNDPRLEAESERLVHLDKLISQDPRFRGKLQNFVVRSVFQGLKDPLSFIPAAVTGEAAEAALRESDIAMRAAMMSKNPLVSKSARVISTNTAERIAQSENAIAAAKRAGTYRDGLAGNMAAIRQTIDDDRKAISAVNSARNTGIMADRKLAEADDALLKKYANEIKQVNPTELQAQRSRLVQQAPRYKPTIDANGKLRWALGEQPKPTTEPVPLWPKEIEDRLDLGRPKLDDDRALDPNRSATVADDPLAVLRGQLAESRKLIRREAVRKQLEENAKGLSPQQIEALHANLDPNKKMPTTEDILKNIASKDPKEVGPSVLRSISDMQIDAMLATGAPHMRNVGVAGLMAMPPQDVAKAAFWAIMNRTPQSLKDRMEKGAASHFGLGEPRSSIVRYLENLGPGNVKPGKLWRGFTSKSLDRWDEALRAADLARVDKTMKGAEEFEKLDRVNQDLGAYSLKPTWTSLAPLWGANFPQWHGYIVPTMFARAMMRRPGQLANMGRLETNFNDQVFGGEPYRWTFGGPLDEGMSAAMDPIRATLLHKYPSYFGGQSTLGAASSLRGGYQTLPENLKKYLTGFIPFGNIYDEWSRNKFKTIPGGALAAANAMGFYAQPRTPSSLRRTVKRTPAATTAASGTAFPGWNP